MPRNEYPPYSGSGSGYASQTSLHQHAGMNDSSAALNEKSGYSSGYNKAGIVGSGAGGFRNNSAGNRRASGLPTAMGAGGATGGRAAGSRKRTYIIVGSILAALVVAGAVVGGVLGTKHSRNSSTSGVGSNAAAADVVVTTTNAAGATITTTASSTSSSNAAAASVSPLPAWEWTQSSYSAASISGKGEPMYGAALGNWLVLEQWIDEPWFNASAGNNASVRDEWTLMQVLGDRAESVMTEHYETWVTEDDIETMYQAGMNHIRIPVGFWAFIPCANGEPYLCNFNQTAYIDRVLGWAYTRGMYAIIDLHALPGSNNGEISSGHLTSNPTFFQPQNQQRSKDTVKAALSYITNSPYRSVVSSLQVINEVNLSILAASSDADSYYVATQPRPYTQGQFDMLADYFNDAYNQTRALSNPVPIIMHHGYPDQVLNLSYTTYWRPFMQNKEPSLMLMSTHPYVGTFPLGTNADQMLGQVCSNMNNFVSFPVPIVITEWSVRTGIKDVSFEKQLYTSELVNWGATGGSIFWNFKAVNGNVNQGDNSQWSFEAMLEKGTVPTPASGQNLMQFLGSLGTPCGALPSVSWAS